MSNKEIIGSGNWLQLVRVGKWEWVRRPNTSGVVGIYAFTDEDEVILIEQERASLGPARVLEIPAGLAGDIVGQEDEAMILAAKRELEEETGYVADEWNEVLECPTSPGLTDESIHLYTARSLSKVGEGGGDESEDIEVLRVPLSEFNRFVQSKQKAGVWIDPKVLAVPYFAVY